MSSLKQIFPCLELDDAIAVKRNQHLFALNLSDMRNYWNQIAHWKTTEQEIIGTYISSFMIFIIY